MAMHIVSRPEHKMLNAQWEMLAELVGMAAAHGEQQRRHARRLVRDIHSITEGFALGVYEVDKPVTKEGQ